MPAINATATARLEITKPERIAWTGPLLLVVARPVLFVFLQAVLAMIFVLNHRPSPWRTAGEWWSVYGTLVDAVCLTLMAWFGRKEGIGLRDLIGKINLSTAAMSFLGSATSS